MITLETARMILRPLDLDDAKLLFGVTGNPEVMRYWTCGPDRSLAETRGRLLVNQEHLKQHGYGDWAIELKLGKKFIGFCGLQHQCFSGKNRVGIGYALDKQHWNQGYGTEAVRCITHHAFATLELPEVVAAVSVDNKASLKILEKCGFKLDHEAIFDGAPRLIYRKTLTIKE